MHTHREAVDLKAIEGTVAAIREQPELAQVSFAVRSEWTGGFRAKSQTGPFVQAGQADADRPAPFEFESDEPPALLGKDSAASAGEYALQALAACYAVTFAANAAAQGIEMESLTLELEGDFDLHGFLGLDKTVRPGMQELRVNARIESSNATPEMHEELVRIVEQRSPIRDTLANPVSVVTTLVE